MVEDKQNWTSAPEKLSKKDAVKTYYRWFFANEIPHSNERLLAPSLLWALKPSLRKLYKDDSALKAAYKRQIEFFNTQLTLGGGVIAGTLTNMEEKRANEEHAGEPVTMSDDMLNMTKTGLMGALAGVGDVIDSGTIQYIFIAIAIPWALAGSAWGALFPFIGFVLYQLLIGRYFAHAGYTQGREAANILSDSKVQNILSLLSILGMFMMGILAGKYIPLVLNLSFEISNEVFVMQDFLDSVMPGLLPIGVVMAVYYYYVKKGLNANKASLWVAIILGVLALVGIL